MIPNSKQFRLNSILKTLFKLLRGRLGRWTAPDKLLIYQKMRNHVFMIFRTCLLVNGKQYAIPQKVIYPTFIAQIRRKGFPNQYSPTICKFLVST